MTLLREKTGIYGDLDLDREYTVDEFLDLNLDGEAELVEGRIVFREMSYTNSIHAALVIWFGNILSNWSRETEWGLILGGDAGIQTKAGPGQVRGADLICISNERYEKVTRKGVIVDVGPELIIEVISPSNTWEDIQSKVKEYLNMGTDEVWVVGPAAREVTVYHVPNRSESFSRADRKTLSARELPGFELPLEEMERLIDRMGGDAD